MSYTKGLNIYFRIILPAKRAKMVRDRFPSLCCQQENANCTRNIQYSAFNIQHSTFNIHQTMLEILENETLARYTSWKIGGPARYFLNAATPDELLEALAWSQERGLSVWLLGGGTNTLALDQGFDGVVLRYRGHTLALEDQDQEGLLRIGAGAPMAGTARRIARQGWAGPVSYTHLGRCSDNLWSRR